MTTISGTAVSAPGSITFSDLVTQARETLSGQDYGTSRWTTARIKKWLKLGIRDYSQRFPRRRTGTITTSADDRKYDLPADFLSIISVEYPTGDDPPTYLKKRPYTHPHFWSSTGYYDILDRLDETNNSEIWISEKPGDSETITIEYNAAHDHALEDESVVTVPEEHHDILWLYVIWQAWVARRETAVQQLEDGEIDRQDYERIRSAVYATKLDYFTAISQAQKYRSGNSRIITWQTDELSQIY